MKVHRLCLGSHGQPLSLALADSSGWTFRLHAEAARKEYDVVHAEFPLQTVDFSRHWKAEFKPL
jgi:hypothetical protein